MAALAFTSADGDTLYEIPGIGGYGFIFARGSDLEGDRLPSAVLLRGGRVYLLRNASAYGITTVRYVSETPITSAFGQAQVAFCYAVWGAWAEYWGIGGSAPTTLATLAEVIGWVEA